MQEDQILKQLNNLKSIQADPEWKQANRSILLQQVLNGETEKSFTIFSQFYLILSRIFQPAYVAVLIAVFFISSGLIGWYGSVNAKPGDSLYVAKIAKERALMTVTFDNQAKAKLNVEFAQNRLKELNQIITAHKNNNDQEARVEELKNNIKKEIKGAKDRIASPQKIQSVKDNNNSVGGEFFTAGVGKTNQEVEVSIPENNKVDLELKPITSSATIVPEDKSKTINSKEPEKILTEAEELLDNDDFEGVASKLSEVNSIISNQDQATIDNQQSDSTKQDNQEKAGQDKK